MKTATLCIFVKDNKVCLGMKKRGFGVNKLNGFGGKIEEGETVEQALIREVKEETDGVVLKSFRKVGEMSYVFPAKPEWNQIVHVFLANKWEGEPKETEEMSVEWHPIANVPYERMWDNDRHWIPLVLDGKKFKGTVHHDGKITLKKEIEIIDTF